MQIADRVIALAKESTARYDERDAIRVSRLRQADIGNVWAADDPERIAKRLAHVQDLTERAAAILPAAALPTAERMPVAAAPDVDSFVTALAEERTIGRDDLVAPDFLKAALAASRSVCRITVRSASGGLLGYGTGMLVGPGIILTNHHVLETAADAAQSEATFGFETGSTTAADERIVRFKPERFFISDEGLDFTLVALAPTDSRSQPADGLPYLALNQEEGKAINGEFVNVIQHPNGGPKMFALRENRIVDVLANYLHYAADTAPGSSGSPVFNDQFEVVALHHSGVPARDAGGHVLNRDGRPWTSDQGETQVHWIANEGVRISVLAERAKSLAKTGDEQALLARVLDVSRSVPRLEVSPVSTAVASGAGWNARPSLYGATATWTIPLSVSVNLGGLAAGLGATPAADPGIVAPQPTPPMPTPQPAPVVSPGGGVGTSPELMRAVAHARDLLRNIPGLVRIRAGWVFTDGWITDKPAIVAVVEEKKTTAALEDAGVPKLPATLDSFPVDVRQATADELAEIGRLPAGPVLEERTPNPTYKKPANLSLPRVKEQMKVTLHVSPEHGWPELKEFLDKTERRLTVAMYDFGAPHILNAINTRLSAQNAKMQLVIQFGSSLGTGTKAHDLDDADTVASLAQHVQDFKMQWADVSQTGSLWASAYHIKVAVRDGTAFWLSSGNWQSSNQPSAAPPADDGAAKDLLTNYNREWHAKVENATLAKVFEAYIKYDFDQSKGFKPKGAAELFEILPPLGPEDLEKTIEIRTFDPLVIDRVVDVQPVLTPDNYVDVVLPLIKSAKSKLYFQNQYINESLDPRAEQNYILLVEAIAEKQKQNVDVRLILRRDTGIEARHIEFMKSHGIDMDRVRWRNGNHTKGIVVDTQRVLLGSHNWSFDGTVLNRDASLLFYDPEIAKYFEQIFVYDWENWSNSKPSIKRTKPKVEEIATAAEMASLQARVASGDIRARRLFHPDDP